MTYIHFDRSALDPLADVDRYREAGEAIEQARQAVADTAAYRDAVVAAMVEARPGRGGQSEVARILGIHRNLVTSHLKNHRERTMHTVTEYVPVLKREISRTWEQKLDYWTTDVDGTTWTLHREGSTGGWTGPDRPVWVWGPRGDDQGMPTIKSHTIEGALTEATWHIDIHPAVEEWQRRRRESQDS